MAIQTPNKISVKEAQQLLEHLWSIGDLRGLLFEHQRLGYDNFYQSEATTTVLHWSRRLGKTAVDLVLLMEACLESDGSICRIGTSTTDAMNEIVIPLMAKLTVSCPEKLRPKLHSSGRYLFPHRPNSQLVLAGLDLHPDRMRGPATKRIAIDEAGFIKNLKYLINDVIMAQFLTEEKMGRLILSSTSPKTPQHHFVERMLEAKATGSYTLQTIYADSRDHVRQRIPQYIKESGGEDSTTWRREYLCEIVTEATHALVPEWKDADHSKLVQDWKRPPLFIPMTVADLGFVDNTGILFGYADFRAGKMIIEDEIKTNRKNSREIARLLMLKENELYGLPGERNFPVRRYADAQPLTIEDFNEIHQCSLVKVSEDSVEAKVNRVRLAIQQEKLVIHPRCRQLLAEIEYGVWNDAHTKFDRSDEAYGHFDLFSALTYFVMNCDLNENPYPKNYGIDPFKTMISSHQKEKTSVADIMKKAFNTR